MTDYPTIFCDEAGFTGNNLFDLHQPCFVYASVAISPDEAAELVTRVRASHGLQGEEIKGSRLARRSRGKDAISDILRSASHRSKVLVVDKIYALAGKFFEYIFEPTISANNLLFYNTNFHRYIATVLYGFFKTAEKSAADMLGEFQTLMRTGSETNLKKLLRQAGSNGEDGPMQQILEFAWLNRNAILSDLSHLNTSLVGRWSLDLTTTSLYSLLTEWGQEHERFSVICDDTKPLLDDTSIFDGMVGRRGVGYFDLRGERRPVTFNLAEPLRFARSVDSHGIQVADVVASGALSLMLKGASRTIPEWVDLLLPALTSTSILPDARHIDLSTLEAMRNGVIMEELLQRSRRGDGLIEGMPHYLELLTHQLRTDGYR